MEEKYDSSEWSFSLKMNTIFVIEDDENIRELIRVALTGYGYTVEVFESAEPALEAMNQCMPGLAIFDIMLPGMTGLEAIMHIRRQPFGKKLPIIVLTAKDKEYDKVIGLDYGADDYITKPFSIMELAARIRALLRRTSEEENKKGVLQEGVIRLNEESREVFCEERKIECTYKEYELLHYLIQNHSRVVSREELLQRIWGYDFEVETRTLDIHIKTLRQKLGVAGAEYIKTIRGVGYRFWVTDIG